jgi:aryl-alcohol dehydrogenase-like predicted oxidoreductase
MEYNKLGLSDLIVSKICLGTMTFGQQNALNDAFEQLDLATNYGVNFIDTAEMYPVPANPETQGKTESYLGDWFTSRKNRNKFILGTKVTGPGLHVKHINENMFFSEKRFSEALHNSLLRLKTDYIDLYQIHWPERKTNCFGKMGFSVDRDDTWSDNIQEVVQILHKFKSQGKIRYWGISNETPWGTMRYLQESKKISDFQLISIQNPYNLVNRTFEIGLAEMAFRENISLLAYSPLAFGLLSGKYHEGHSKPTDRLNQFKNMARYNSPVTFNVVSKYLDIANRHGISLAKMSLSYLMTKPYVTSVIIGATDNSQLKENMESIDITLSDQIINEIELVHKDFANPAP